MKTRKKASITKIISGGQTGADRAALDWAIKDGIPHGGSIPKGRRTEDGPLPDKYNLQEMPTASYPQRTEQNILDSDGTLIISHGPLKGGSALTRKLALRHGKPCIHINLNQFSQEEAASGILEWMKENEIKILNVAGPRASEDLRIYKETIDLLTSLHLTKFLD